MRHETKVRALEYLLRVDEQERKCAAMRGVLSARLGTRSSTPDELSAAAIAVHAAQEGLYAAKEAFNALPKPRRTWAIETRAFAVARAREGCHLGGIYSGSTSSEVKWGSATRAYTTTAHGDKYSRRCRFSKIDACHVVELCAADVARLAGHEDIGMASGADGLPVVGYTADGRYVWVSAGKGKTIAHEVGWIGFSDGQTYHSTKSKDDADAGAVRKAKKVAQAKWEANHSRTIERRARLVARMCGGAVATIGDARALGYCEPGIASFQAKHGIGDTASLPELVRTGDAAAIRLALQVARRVSRRVEKAAQAVG